MSEKELEQLPALLTVKEMAGILNIGRTAAYKIIHERDFQILRLGAKVIRVPRCELIKWIRKNK